MVCAPTCYWVSRSVIQFYLQYFRPVFTGYKYPVAFFVIGYAVQHLRLVFVVGARGYTSLSSQHTQVCTGYYPAGSRVNFQDVICFILVSVYIPIYVFQFVDIAYRPILVFYFYFF